MILLQAGMLAAFTLAGAAIGLRVGWATTYYLSIYLHKRNTDV